MRCSWARDKADSWMRLPVLALQAPPLRPALLKLMPPLRRRLPPSLLQAAWLEIFLFVHKAERQLGVGLRAVTGSSRGLDGAFLAPAADERRSYAQSALFGARCNTIGNERQLWVESRPPTRRSAPSERSTASPEPALAGRYEWRGLPTRRSWPLPR